MAEWFKDWFASEEYLSVYRHRNDEDAARLFRLIREKTGLKPPASVLDVACGAGRHSFLFASQGFRVTAFDLSKTLLSYARKRGEEQNLKVDFLCSDIRTLELSARFDLIINLFTSFGYFSTDRENFLLFDKVKEHLSTGGTFVFDYFNSHHVRDNLVASSTDSVNGKTLIQKRTINGNRVIKEIIISDESSRNLFFESVCLYDYVRIRTELEERGFRITGLYGDYLGQSFQPDKSPRLLIFAEINSKI